MRQVIKTAETVMGVWELARISETRYFSKSGRPNLHVRITYEVVCRDAEGVPVMGEPNVFWLTRKATAEKHFKIVTTLGLEPAKRAAAIDNLYNKEESA